MVWKPSLGCGIKAIHPEMKPPDPRIHSELSVRSCVLTSLPSEYYSQENLHEGLATYFAHGEERVIGWEKKGATQNQAFKFILQCCLGYVPTEDRVFRIPTSLISV